MNNFSNIIAVDLTAEMIGRLIDQIVNVMRALLKISLSRTDADF